MLRGSLTKESQAFRHPTRLKAIRNFMVWKYMCENDIYIVEQCEIDDSIRSSDSGGLFETDRLQETRSQAVHILLSVPESDVVRVRWLGRDGKTLVVVGAHPEVGVVFKGRKPIQGARSAGNHRERGGLLARHGWRGKELVLHGEQLLVVNVGQAGAVHKTGRDACHSTKVDAGALAAERRLIVIRCSGHEVLDLGDFTRVGRREGRRLLIRAVVVAPKALRLTVARGSKVLGRPAGAKVEAVVVTPVHRGGAHGRAEHGLLVVGHVTEHVEGIRHVGRVLHAREVQRREPAEVTQIRRSRQERGGSFRFGLPLLLKETTAARQAVGVALGVDTHTTAVGQIVHRAVGETASAVHGVDAVQLVRSVLVRSLGVLVNGLVVSVLVEGEEAVRMDRFRPAPRAPRAWPRDLYAHALVVFRVGLRNGVEVRLLLMGAGAAATVVAAAAFYNREERGQTDGRLGKHRVVDILPLWPSTGACRCEHLCVFSPQSHLTWEARDLRMVRQCWHCDTGRPFLLMC